VLHCESVVTQTVVCSALQFYRRTDDVSNDMEEMDTEFQQKASVRKKNKADVEKPAAAAGTDDDAEQSKATGDSGTFTLAKLLLTAELRRPLFVACMLQVIQQFSGINAVRSLSCFIYTHSSLLIEHFILRSFFNESFSSFCLLPALDI